MLDERVDKFSELVDSNLETLRKAISDNRDVYVSVINKSNLEQEERMNGFVEDLENIVNELYDVQTKIDSGAIGANKQATDETPDALSKQLHDLEAHLNTSIITEKSVRKAQDKYLAEEIDKFQEQMKIIEARLSNRDSENERNLKENKSENDLHIGENQENIQKLEQTTAELRAEVTALKNEAEKEGEKMKVTGE